MANTTSAKIWCIFRVANNYDQPSNDLVAWWQEKPTIEKLATFLACPLDSANDQSIANVVDVWRGKDVRFSGVPHYDASFRLEEVPEGGV